MKKVMIFAVPLVAVAVVFAWRITGMLSPDAIGMVIGLFFGVIAGIPSAALIVLARRRDDEDYGDGTDCYPRTVDQYHQPEYQPEYTPTVFRDSPVVPWRAPAPAPVFYEDVTPYYNGARRLMGMEPLPRRADMEPTRLTAQQISELEDYILFQKTGGIRQVDPRQFIVRFSGDER